MAETIEQTALAPNSGVGPRLKAAREGAGLSLAQVSDITKIPGRMLTLIEAGNFAALPARTYATGFTRTYARALGLDEKEFVAAVRSEIGATEPVERHTAQTFEPGDPARIPSARFAWLAALAALVVIAAGLFLWRSYYSPAVALPSLLPEDAATAAPAALPTAAAIPPAAVPPAMAPAATLPAFGPAVAEPAAPAQPAMSRVAPRPPVTPVTMPSRATGETALPAPAPSATAVN